MSRARALIGSGAAVAFARLFSLACAAVQLPLLTRLLDPSEYSAIAVMIAIATYFSLLSAEPVILSFERYPGSSEERVAYRYALTRTLSYVAVATILAVAIALPLGFFEQALAFAGWGIGIAVNRLISLAWLMWERPWQYSFNLAAGTGTRTAVLLILILAGWSPSLSLGAAGLASAAVALIVSPRAHKRALRGKTVSRPWSFSFGINLAVASLAYTILTNGNLLILAAFESSSTVGAYAVMMQVATLTSAAILGLVLAVAYPPLRLAWDNGRQNFVHASLSTLQTACIGVGSATVFVAYIGDHFLLRLVIPETFIDSGVLAPLIMSTVFATMGGMASWHHQLKFEAARVARRTMSTAFVGIVLTIGLTALFQERGAAIGAVLGFVLYLLVMQRGTGLPARTVVVAIGALLLTSGALFVPGCPSELVAFPALAAFVFTSLQTTMRYRSRRLIWS